MYFARYDYLIAFAIIESQKRSLSNFRRGLALRADPFRVALLRFSIAVRIFILYGIGTDTNCQPDADMQGQGAISRQLPHSSKGMVCDTTIEKHICCTRLYYYKMPFEIMRGLSPRSLLLNGQLPLWRK